MVGPLLRSQHALLPGPGLTPLKFHTAYESLVKLSHKKGLVYSVSKNTDFTGMVQFVCSSGRCQ
jgi:hypothetical protein